MTVGEGPDAGSFATSVHRHDRRHTRHARRLHMSITSCGRVALDAVVRIQRHVLARRLPVRFISLVRAACTNHRELVSLHGLVGGAERHIIIVLSAVDWHSFHPLIHLTNLHLILCAGRHGKKLVSRAHFVKANSRWLSGRSLCRVKCLLDVLKLASHVHFAMLTS